MGRLIRRRRLDPRHPHFKARVWVPRDLDELAQAIADLALGQWRHVERLLQSTNRWEAADADYAIDSAIRSLTVLSGKDPWHRDGWVFQLISWIAAVEANPGPARLPQMDQASKGLDGLQLVIGRLSGKVKGAIIFEDKATDSPRDTVRDDVWPSFVKLEAGDRSSALAAEIASLLDRVPNVDPQAAVDRIMRDPKGRAYRVSVTAGNHHAGHESLNGLFKGFETTVVGSRSRRYGNVLEVEDLRPWMSDLCARAIALLERARSCSTP